MRNATAMPTLRPTVRTKTVANTMPTLRPTVRTKTVANTMPTLKPRRTVQITVTSTTVAIIKATYA